MVLIDQFVGRVGTLLMALMPAAAVVVVLAVAAVAVVVLVVGAGAGAGVCWDAASTPHSLAILRREGRR